MHGRTVFVICHLSFSSVWHCCEISAMFRDLVNQSCILTILVPYWKLIGNVTETLPNPLALIQELSRWTFFPTHFGAFTFCREHSLVCVGAIWEVQLRKHLFSFSSTLSFYLRPWCPSWWHISVSFCHWVKDRVGRTIGHLGAHLIHHWHHCSEFINLGNLVHLLIFWKVLLQFVFVLFQLDGSGYNISLVRYSEEIRAVVVGNLTAFTLYSITITAFTGEFSNARTDGKTSEPVLARTLEDGEDVCACLIIRYPLNACMHNLIVTFTVMFSQSPKILPKTWHWWWSQRK